MAFVSKMGSINFKKNIFYFYFLLFFQVISSTIFAQFEDKNKATTNIAPLIFESQETSLAFGGVVIRNFKLKKEDSISRISSLQFLSVYTLNKQFIVVLNGTQFTNKEKYILTEQISYSSFPDKFFKIGNKTTYNESESYTYKQFYFNAQLTRKVLENINLGLRTDIQRVFSVEYVPNGYLHQIYGDISNGFFTAGLGISASIDKRNNTYAPDKGYFAQIYLVDYKKIFKSDYTFTNINLDFRKFIKSGKSSVLALQLFSNINIGEIIPVRNLSGIGGTNISRGYYDSRFIDKNSAIIQAEYRQSLENVPISFFKNFGVVFFGSFGDVFSNPNQLSIKLLKTSIGTGLRYALNKSQRINIRFDVGFNVFDKTFAPLIQIGEAF